MSHLNTSMGLVATWEENKITQADKIIFSSHHRARNTGVEFRKVTLVFSDGDLEMVDTQNSSGLCLYQIESEEIEDDATLYYTPKFRYLEYL